MDTNANTLGPFVVETDSFIPQLQCLYLSWDEARRHWMSHAMPLGPGTGIPEINSPLLHKARAPRTLNVLIAPNPANLSKINEHNDYHFCLTARTITAYRWPNTLDTNAKTTKPAWSYDITQGIVPVPETVLDLSRQRPLEKAYLNYQALAKKYDGEKEAQKKLLSKDPLIGPILHANQYDFFSSSNVDFLVELEHTVDVLQNAADSDNQRRRHVLAQRYCAGMQMYLSSHLEYVSALISVAQIYHQVVTSKKYEQTEDVFQSVTNEQLKWILVHYGMDISEFSTFCRMMRPERLSSLIDLFTVTELSTLMQTQATEPARVQGWLYKNLVDCVTQIAKHLSQARFEQLVAHLFKKNWDIFWSTDNKGLNLLHLLQPLDPKKRQVLLTYAPIKNIITNHLKEIQYYLKKTNVPNATPYSQSELLLGLEQFPPHTLADCILLTSQSLHEEDTLLQSIPNQTLREWCQLPHNVNSLLAALKTPQQYRLIHLLHNDFIPDEPNGVEELLEFLKPFDHITLPIARTLRKFQLLLGKLPDYVMNAFIQQDDQPKVIALLARLSPAQRQERLAHCTTPCEGLALAIATTRCDLQRRGIQAPYAHLDLAALILTQVQHRKTHSSDVLNDAVLSCCTQGIYQPTDPNNLRRLIDIAKQLTRNATKTSNTLGMLLYSFSGVLILVGLLAVIPSGGGSLLMALCLAAKFHALAEVVVHGALTAGLTLGGGLMTAAATYRMGFFNPPSLLQHATEFREGVMSSMAPV